MHPFQRFDPTQGRTNNIFQSISSLFSSSWLSCECRVPLCNSTSCLEAIIDALMWGWLIEWFLTILTYFDRNCYSDIGLTGLCRSLEFFGRRGRRSVYCRWVELVGIKSGENWTNSKNPRVCQIFNRDVSRADEIRPVKVARAFKWIGFWVIFAPTTPPIAQS